MSEQDRQLPVSSVLANILDAFNGLVKSECPSAEFLGPKAA